ncbi:nucleotidyl transferase AbiEii/AbiGii toxin family protein [Luteolibacter algae]|uniref:Nucleotidyl transferase AbiEii/AbiGii toxin family protein n=1 Tax=Luteolibacter algae TaxID=454151 RepID=A0ABW5D8G8_9BACT
MPLDYLHNHKDFADLLRIVGAEMSIDPVLVEKDYWIMHCLHGLQQLGMNFELKGGTSLSKGFRIINRFSEDIDIRIDPPEELKVSTGRNHDKPAQVESRKRFYDWLAETIKIDGIISIERDTTFDDAKYRSGGIRLNYKEVNGTKADLKQGVLLEVGFDDVTPNIPQDISSWAYDYAAEKVEIIDNRANGVLCYNPGYTLVEKLQTISTKFRKQQESGEFPVNFMRHYYDVYCLLEVPSVIEFIGSDEYKAHKDRRFRSENPDITKNEAFLLNATQTRNDYERAYEATKSLYYQDRPSLVQILSRIMEYAKQL